MFNSTRMCCMFLLDRSNRIDRYPQEAPSTVCLWRGPVWYTHRLAYCIFSPQRFPCCATTIIHMICDGMYMITVYVYILCLGWLTYSGPFDCNTWTLNHITFRNPLQFTKTPYMMYIKQLRISMSVSELWVLLRDPRDAPIRFEEIIVSMLDYIG